MSDNLFEKIKELSLNRFKKQAKLANPVFVGLQVDTNPATGAPIFRIGVVEAADPKGKLYTVIVDELGQEVDLKATGDKERRRLFAGDEFIQYSYIVKFVCGVQEAAGCCCPTGVRPGAYATEINIFNYNDTSAASLSKTVYPVVLGGLPIGREPRSVGAKGWDWMSLPPNNATMDDCCRIHHLLFDAEPLVKPSLTIGFMEIVSDRDLQVTAVYTATDLENRSISIEVETISPKVKYQFRPGA
jgi:hypothetical protein